MQNAKHSVKVKRNEDGKVIVKLYGTEFDVTDETKNGSGHARFFGEDYDIEVLDEEVPMPKSKPAKSTGIKVTDKSKTTKLRVKFVKK